MNRCYTPDPPVVRQMEQTGYPSGKEPAYPRCPECGAETDTLYTNRIGGIVGCDSCLTPADAWECGECFPGEE